jgi:opacity protein-like surface antigen
MRLLMLAAVLMTVPGVAAGQSSQGSRGRSAPKSGGWSGPLRVSVNVGSQVTGTTLEQSFDLTRNLEPMPVKASIEAKKATVIDGGVAFKLFRGFAVGYAYTATSHTATGDVTAAVPHPFFFDRRRPISGTVRIPEDGSANHISAEYIVPAGPVEVTLLGGPTFFSIKQTLVTDITYTEEYPYDTATFSSATTTLVKQNVTGYHVGADVAVKLTRNIGVGALARFSRASTATLTAAAGNTVKYDVGGLQVSGGLRLAF